jgi:hypothetical protein
MLLRSGARDKPHTLPPPHPIGSSLLGRKCRQKKSIPNRKCAEL